MFRVWGFSLVVFFLSVCLFLEAFFYVPSFGQGTFDKVYLLFFKYLPAANRVQPSLSYCLILSDLFSIPTRPQAAATSVWWFPTCISSGSWEHCMLITQFCTQQGATSRRKRLGHRNKSSSSSEVQIFCWRMQGEGCEEKTSGC